jgi:hypothetical protein
MPPTDLLPALLIVLRARDGAEGPVNEEQAAVIGALLIISILVSGWFALPSRGDPDVDE